MLPGVVPSALVDRVRNADGTHDNRRYDGGKPSADAVTGSFP